MIKALITIVWDDPDAPVWKVSFEAPGTDLAPLQAAIDTFQDAARSVRVRGAVRTEDGRLPIPFIMVMRGDHGQ